MSHPLLDIRHLRVWFPKGHTFFGKVTRWVKAVDDVCFTLHRGETLALVGESGSGKTTTSLAILRAHTPREGEILFSPDGQRVCDLAALKQKEIRPYRKNLQMIFQDPFSSLSPRMTVKQIISEPLKVNKIGNAKQRTERVKELLAEVGLSPQFLNRYPHAFSGGQRQRIGIARALALQPELIVCDEPVSALDVSVQAQVINLMMELKERYDLAYLFIAHDLEVVRHIADRVAVMYAGRLVEAGPKKKIFENPLHPYTQCLLAVSPKPDPERPQSPRVLSGRGARPVESPHGLRLPPPLPQGHAAVQDDRPRRDAYRRTDRAMPAVRELKMENGGRRGASLHSPLSILNSVVPLTAGRYTGSAASLRRRA